MPNLVITQTQFTVGSFNSNNKYLYKNPSSPVWYIPHGILGDVQSTGETRFWYAGGADDSDGYTGGFASPGFTGVTK